VDLLLVIIELCLLSVTAEVLRVKINWKLAFWKRWVSFGQFFG